MNNSTIKRVTIIFLLAVSVIISGVLFASNRNKPTDTAPVTTNEATTDTKRGGTDLVGFESLAKAGVSAQQISFLKDGLRAYAFTMGNYEGFSSILLKPETVRIQSQEVLGFRVVLDNSAEYLTRLAHGRDGSIQFMLYNDQGEVVFDSGLIEPESS